ncbi:YxeA family protein [Extibacter muris]|uniref:YxeA family protein n=1 Tax=Extibacter muris TaxID=1796622 RepID=A0A4R4FE48_9FIRM|nr:YxeA family protein [Extibacter muris]MCU0080405.1 YxeA family protein [Extibacter muris]TDA21013.1 YxeA family protein [Extibacter muris]
MKSKKVIVGIIVTILVVICMGVAFLATQNDNYYTQIDNRWVQEIAPHGAMNYKYTLKAYDEDGNEKDVVFETSRILTDDAFLCLKVNFIRGVVTWAEVEYKELPARVQQYYNE